MTGTPPGAKLAAIATDAPPALHRRWLLDSSLLESLVTLAASAPIWLVTRPERFSDPARFPAAVDLQRRAPELVAECAAYVATAAIPAVQEADTSQARLNHDDRWKMLVLRALGRDVEVNQRRLPALAAYLRAHPEVVSATVSVLAPGKGIFWHPGTVKGVIRMHLAVEVPPGRLELDVAGAARPWVVGEVLVFDDCFPHRVVNETTGRRTVILFDLARPLPWGWLRRANAGMIRWLGNRYRVRAIEAAAEAWAAEEAAGHHQAAGSTVSR